MIKRIEIDEYFCDGCGEVSGKRDVTNAESITATPAAKRLAFSIQPAFTPTAEAVLLPRL
jgi:hypothetical protein